jgi:hypothetical protein
MERMLSASTPFSFCILENHCQFQMKYQSIQLTTGNRKEIQDISLVYVKVVLALLQGMSLQLVRLGCDCRTFWKSEVGRVQVQQV